MVNILSDYIPPFSPLPNIAPFTYKDGETYLSTLDALRIYVNTTIIGFINTNFIELSESFTTEVNTLIDQVQGQLSDQDSALDTKIAELITTVNDSVQSVINSSITVSDPVIYGVLSENDSQSRGLIDTFYSANPGRSVNQAPYNTINDGSAGASSSIQLAINDARDAVRANYKNSGIVIIEAGSYLLDTKIIQPPYVKVITHGNVTFKTIIDNDSAWMITPLVDDPATLDVSMSKQQWQTGSLLDGSNGGIVFINTLGTTSNTIGLELGSGSDLGISRCLARYSLNDINLFGYHKPIKWNIFNHYIASYDRIRIEGSDQCVQIGGASSNVNSGENITWNDCLFGTVNGLNSAFIFDASSVDFQFNNCSFDYIHTIFQYNQGWQRTVINGGHIEAINEGTRYDPNGGIAVSNVTSSRYPEVVINGPTHVCSRRGTFFRGIMLLELDVHYRNRTDSEFVQAENMYYCDSNVRVYRSKMISQSGQPVTARQLNVNNDSGFVNQTVGDATNVLSNWAQNSGSVTGSISSDSPFGDAKSAKVKITGSGYLRLNSKTFASCKPGDNIRSTMAFKSTSAAITPTLAAYVQFYDSAMALIGAATSVNFFKATNAANEWRVPDNIASWRAPAGAAFYSTGYMVSTANGDGVAEFYMSELFSYVI